ncbi:hypothetical protein APT58_08290 [Corynebacterium glutamicum]|nr:hypothetical protein APT58_08290 [Corynebacterium glutamicum]
MTKKTNPHSITVFKSNGAKDHYPASESPTHKIENMREREGIGQTLVVKTKYRTVTYKPGTWKTFETETHLLYE